MEFAMIGLKIVGGMLKAAKMIGKGMIFMGLGWFIPFVLLSILDAENPHTFTLWVGILGTCSIYANKIGRMIFRNTLWTWWGAVLTLITHSDKFQNIGIKADLRTSGKGNIHGFVFGKIKNEYVTVDEEEDKHILVLGGPGSGKTADVVLPTFASWQNRIFAIDIKGDLYKKTRKARENQPALILDPQDANTCGYDPLYNLKNSQNIVQDVSEIVNSIIPIGADVKDPMWLTNAQMLLNGSILHFYHKGVHNFADIIKNVRMSPTKDLIDNIMSGDCELAKLQVSGFVGMSDKTLSGIVAELNAKITVFCTDSSLINTLNNSRSMILTPHDLEHNDVFIKLDESMLDQWQPLLTMICNQFLKSFERRSEDCHSMENKNPILFMLDEFPRLGKIKAIQNGLATLRSRGIQICLVIQSKSQLDMIYGADTAKAICDSCNYKAILRATEPDTQKWCSDLVGTYERLKTTTNDNKNKFSINGSTGTSTTTEEKKIIKPEQFAYLQDQLVLITPTGYEWVDKTPYYADEYFKKAM